MVGNRVVDNSLEVQKNLPLWQTFAQQENLDDTALQAFIFYTQQLVAWNEQMNLTAITQIPAIITDHFQDSLALGHHVSLSANTPLVDVGSGAGFPGIPLAIKYPELPVTLLEVNNKKVQFLTMIIQTLGLRNCQIQSVDFRTFIRQAPIPVHFFVARASLAVPELLRILSPASKYANSKIIYWASRHWAADTESAPHIVHRYSYTVDTKQRMLVVLANTHHTS